MQKAKRKRPALWFAAAFIGLLAVLLYVVWAGPLLSARNSAAIQDRAAAVALKSGDIEGAESHWTAAITAWPDDTIAYSALGDFYGANHQFDLAAVAYRRLLQIDPHYPHIYCRLAQAARAHGADGDAQHYAEQELQNDPRCILALDLLSMLDGQRGAHQKAQAEGEKAYRLAPTDEKTVLAYAESFLPGEPSRALPILAGAELHLSQSAPLAYDLGWCYAHSRSDAASKLRAINEYKRAIALAPGYQSPHRELGALYMQQNDLTNAVHEGSIAVQLNPYDGQAWLRYSQSLLASGQQAEGKRAYAKFQGLEAAREKKSQLSETYRQRPGDPGTAHSLAQALEELGDIQHARLVLETALQVHPQDATIQSDIAKLLKSETGR